jgi:DNA invertase Pin-like site-specific DNA recombinase
VAAAHAQFDNTTFDDAWAAGRALSLDEMAAEVLAVLARSPGSLLACASRLERTIDGIPGLTSTTDAAAVRDSMDAQPDQTELSHPGDTRAIVYLWDHPTAAAFCGMEVQKQRQRCTGWAAAHGWSVVATLVDDHASPAPHERPALQRLRAAAHTHACDVVITPTLFSLGPQIEQVLALIDLLAGRAIDLVAIHESFDTQSAHGSFALLIVRRLAQIAQQSQLTSAPPAPEAAALSTRPPASQRATALPFGYRQTAQGIVVDPEKAATVRRIFRLRDAGATVPELVQLLREHGNTGWNQRALTLILANEAAYRGGPHPASGHWPVLLDER